MLRPEVSKARKFRRALTLPEVMLWQELRGGRLGMKFRRQHPIGPYIADFCCVSARLVVEVDGSAHNDRARVDSDTVRDRFIQNNGYRVLRIRAADVQRDLASALAAVAHAALPLHHASHGPPPRSGED